MNINYYVNEDGELFIYDGNSLIVSISECDNTDEKTLLAIIAEEIEASIYINNNYSKNEIKKTINALLNA